MVVDIRCPKGCGPMEYKTNRNLKVRVFDPIGYALIIAGIPFLAAKEAPYFDFVPNLIVSYAIGLGLVMLGAYRASLVTTDLVCNTCRGLILESKSLDHRLKDDADFIRSEISSSSQTSELDCVDCGNKMKTATITVSDHTRHHQDQFSLLPQIISDVSSFVGTTASREIDGCIDCDLVWFDAGEEGFLSQDSTVILTE